MRRLLAFVFTTGLGSVAGVISAPVIIAGAGEYEWGIQAAIQSAGVLFGVFIAFGWGTTGAAEVASMPVANRAQWYADSLVSRMYLLCLGYPAMVVLMVALNPTYVPLVLVGCAAYVLSSVGASWYFVGEARPDRLFRFDALPQVIGIFASIGVMLLTGSLVWTVATQFVFNLLAVVLSAVVILRNAAAPVRFNWSVAAVLPRLRDQRHAVTNSATTALYSSAPLLILNAIAPTALPLYAMGDRLYRFGLAAFAPILQFAQGWIPELGPENLDRRIMQVTRLTPLVSILGGACVFLLGPWVASVLSQGAIDLGYLESLAFGLVLVAVTVGQVLGLAVLVPLGKRRQLAVSPVIGALLGIPLLFAGALLFGATGAAWALALSEVAVMAYQTTVVVSTLRSRRRGV